MSAVAEALADSRVDVVQRIRDGIPARSFVPGAEGLLPSAKRVHISAPRKSGKSLSIGVVTAVQIVAAGGRVVVLDRENGPDEFARRLGDVLEAHEADDALGERVRERLSYHAWPALDLAWRDDPSYAAAFGDADIVVFDSTRSHLTPLGLKEDQSDDFATFTTALIDPLMQAGVTTVTLDNTGHSDPDRARGSSAKEDLADIVFTMKALTPFSSTQAGRLELRCTASRFGDVDGAWHMQIGGGQYGPWERVRARPPEARGELRDAVVEVLAAAGETLGTEKIGKAIRGRPGNTLKFPAKDLRAGLEAWAADPASGVLRDPSGRGFTTHVRHARHGGHVGTLTTQLDTSSLNTVRSPATTGSLPMSDSPDTARHGVHVAGRPPVGGDTADTQAETGGHGDWTDDQLQALIDGDGGQG